MGCIAAGTVGASINTNVMIPDSRNSCSSKNLKGIEAYVLLEKTLTTQSGSFYAATSPYGLPPPFAGGPVSLKPESNTSLFRFWVASFAQLLDFFLRSFPHLECVLHQGPS